MCSDHFGTWCYHNDSQCVCVLCIICLLTKPVSGRSSSPPADGCSCRLFSATVGVSQEAARRGISPGRAIITADTLSLPGVLTAISLSWLLTNWILGPAALRQNYRLFHSWAADFFVQQGPEETITQPAAPHWGKICGASCSRIQKTKPSSDLHILAFLFSWAHLYICSELVIIFSSIIWLH